MFQGLFNIQVCFLNKRFKYQFVLTKRCVSTASRGAFLLTGGLVEQEKWYDFTGGVLVGVHEPLYIFFLLFFNFTRFDLYTSVFIYNQKI